MTMEDIPEGLALCRHAGWNQLETDWKFFLEQNNEGCRVAVDDNDHVIGTVATINYEDKFSWVGMVLVDPSKKRMGIGTRLLNEALQILQGNPCIRLDATPAGREVYLKLGFTDEYKLTRMIHHNVRNEPRVNEQVAAMSATDLQELMLTDLEIFGASREHLLKRMFERSPALAFVLKKDNAVSGYCFGRDGFNHMQIGPVVAEDTGDAVKLVTAVMNQCEGRSVLVDANHVDAAWLNRLSQLGFMEERPFIRMFLGVNVHAGIPGKQFAILGPEFG